MATGTTSNRSIKSPHKGRYENFIGGKWVAPEAGRYFKNISPINGQVICEVPRSTVADVEAALNAAHAAKDKWGKMSVAERSLISLRIADRIEENLELIGEAETWDNDKPIHETRAADIPLVVDDFRYFAVSSEHKKVEYRKLIMILLPTTSMKHLVLLDRLFLGISRFSWQRGN